jgi:FtsZ-binding cell division protein ZapB
LSQQLAELRQQVVLTEDAAILQEIGLYDYTHPLSDSTKYKDALAALQGQIKAMARVDGGAIEATTSWTVNGSQAEGRRMVRDFSKLMLRAYNAEADNLVRGMKPYKLESAKDRLEKVALTIAKLGKSMQIRVSPGYHRLRIRELELAADFREMLAREKDKEREERERLREARKVQAEIEREREKLKKEQSHYQNALDALIAKGDIEAADRMRAQLADIQKAIEDVDYRAANARAGYVYVISNLGSFGERMIKVGMTRRLEPLDRIKELSDASVPFNFDVHALFFADDAVGIENKMHQQLADRRVNRVNTRREFFYATPAEARELLMQLTGDLLQFDEAPEALEFHQSVNTTPH